MVKGRKFNFIVMDVLQDKKMFMVLTYLRGKYQATRAKVGAEVGIPDIDGMMDKMDNNGLLAFYFGKNVTKVSCSSLGLVVLTEVESMCQKP